MGLVKNKMTNIINLFKPEELQQKSDGNYKTICPHCGLQGGRTEGFILFPESNIAFCHTSQKWFTLLETYALKNKIINCIEGREKGEKRKILSPQQFKISLDLMQEEFNEEEYEKLLDLCGVREKIELPGTGIYISDFANKLIRKLKMKQELFFREDLQEVVEITPLGFNIIKPNRFITLTERYFKPWCKIWKRNGDTIQMNKSMNQQTSSIVLVSPNFQDKLPKIKRIFAIPIPIIYKEKITFPKKGYDKRFESWLNYKSPTINQNLSLEEAKKILYKIYNEFCFQNKQDYVNAIAGLLTPFLRGLYSNFNVRTPLFCYLANRERAGKDYCANITGLVIEGTAVEEPPISSGEFRSSGTNDEIRKKIVSNFILGKKRFHSSNNKGKINNAVFESILTATFFSDRILGGNDTKTFSNEIDFSLSGNLTLTMTPDLANRSRFINLFLDIEDANERKFENPNLHKWVLDNKSLIISAIFSLIKNWVNKGCPKGSIPFASYPEWAEICGGIMETAKIGNPCVKDKKIEQGISLDEETDEMKILFELCFEKYPNKKLKKNDIKKLIKDDELFLYIDWEKKSDQTKFGVKLNKYVGRILSNIRLIVKNKKIRTSRWEYEFTKEKSNFDKKDIFNTNFDEKDDLNIDFDEKDGNLGNDGNDCTYPGFPIEYSKLRRGKKVSKVAKVTIQNKDRQVQFFEAEECKNIIIECSKEEIKDYIKHNPEVNFKEIFKRFGNGSIKFFNQIKKEMKIQK